MNFVSKKEMTINKNNTIAGGVLLVTLVTLFVKVLGFIKQMVIAYVYGASSSTDVFFISSEFITNIASAIFSALSVMLIPIYLNKPKDERNKLLSDIVWSFLFISIIIVIIGELFADPLATLLRGGSSNIDNNELAYYLRVLIPTLLITCIVFIYKSVLDAEKVFVPGRLLGAIQSVTIIAFSLTLSSYFGVKALLFAFCLATVLEWLLLSFYVKGDYRKQKPILFSDNFKVLFKQMLPLCIGSTIADISVIIDKIIAANLGAGVASSLAYGQTLKQFVSASIIMTCISVVFVYLSETIANKDKEKTIYLINKTVSVNALILIPVSIVSFVCSSDIVQILFERGAFSHDDTVVVSSILRGYSIGFVFLAGRAIFSRVCYAFQDTISPMINGIIAICFNIVLSIVLSRFLGALGITIATSLAYLVSSILLYFSVKKKLPEYSISHNFSFVVKIAVAMIICIALVYLFLKYINISPVFNLFAGTVISFVVFYGVLALLKCKELGYCYELVLHFTKK